MVKTVDNGQALNLGIRGSLTICSVAFPMSINHPPFAQWHAVNVVTSQLYISSDNIYLVMKYCCAIALRKETEKKQRLDSNPHAKQGFQHSNLHRTNHRFPQSLTGTVSNSHSKAAKTARMPASRGHPNSQAESSSRPWLHH